MMTPKPRIFSTDLFSSTLYQKMARLCPAVAEMELYEFQYGLNNLYPEPGGWESIATPPLEALENQVRQRDFYLNIKLKPIVNGKITLDDAITQLTRILFVGLVTSAYSEEWINQFFYFDPRGFFFLVRTEYYTPSALAHLGGKPLFQFESQQKNFERVQDIGYTAFKAANAAVDQKFIQIVQQLAAAKGTPILLTLAGPTAAGKTEITARLCDAFKERGQNICTIEMDSFLLDNDYRDNHGIKTLGTEAYHFELFLASIRALLQGKKASIPVYDSAVSSHDLQGKLKPGFHTQEVEPADIIILEGNFPFQLKLVSDLIGIKIVYLTDDPIRLKRKWKRDIDYRQKYDTNYFRNRYFRTQFLRAQDIYQAQMQVCDLLVDTTQAAIWASPQAKTLLQSIPTPQKEVIQP